MNTAEELEIGFQVAGYCMSKMAVVDMGTFEGTDTALAGIQQFLLVEEGKGSHKRELVVAVEACMEEVEGHMRMGKVAEIQLVGDMRAAVDGIVVALASLDFE